MCDYKLTSTGILICLATFLGCERSTEFELFRAVDPDKSNVHFMNNIATTDSFNVLNYMYFYNGGGVAVGDINNDGLEDIYFSSNQSTGKLYLNEGQMKFRDITLSSGVTSSIWGTGVSMVDINEDGFIDLYVCASGSKRGEARKNLLFINNGDLTFTEQGSKYGLADTSYTTHAAFFDYDKDGDLDVYLVNHMHQFSGPNDPLPKKTKGQSPNTDRLLRNVWDSISGHPVFEDVSSAAGILIEGFGLGVAISDINMDGWPDVYVSNDFVSNDLLYINNRDGTFSNKIGDYLKHQSHNGMGNDISDFNNDGLPDIFVADMLPEKNKHRKLMAMNTGYDLFNLTQAMGYEPQYTRNTLQMHNGFDRNGDLLPFSEIGQLAHIHATDWSWSVLFADFDNDHLKDLFITNGHLKDLTDLDFIVYRQMRSRFTTAKQRDSLYLELLELMPGIHTRNYFYRNTGNLEFEDMSASCGGMTSSYSNGAVYSDLDNDGDLDLIINNVNEKASILQNLSRERAAINSNYLQLNLIGPKSNSCGRGAKITLYTSDGIQYLEQNPGRGYLSSVSRILHFGLDTTRIIDSILIQWPDFNEQILREVRVNQRLDITWDDSHVPAHTTMKSTMQAFESESFFLAADSIFTSDARFVHIDREYSDFKVETLLPRTYATQGPGVAVGDVDNNGYDDMVIGGSAGIPIQILFQDHDGFRRVENFPVDSVFEDIGVLLFDCDADSDLDLYVVSGGSEYWASPEMFQDRLYLNDGAGKFERSPGAIPEIHTSGSCVTASDFDGDGDLDLFVGGRIVPGQYGRSPRSYLLINNDGVFEDMTQQLSPDLFEVGMVTSSLWTDFDNDGDVDLIVVGEWMPITCFANEGGRLKLIDPVGLDMSDGWWNSIVGGDFDNDGDIDYIVGNLGLNSDYKASQEAPVQLYSGYLDQNRSWDALLCNYMLDEDEVLRSFPIHFRKDLIGQMASVQKSFPDFESYSTASIQDILSVEQLNLAQILSAHTMQSSYLENLGNSDFELHPLPIRAQISPIHGMIVRDINRDGNLDVICVANFYGADVRTGRYDASNGMCLLGNGQGEFYVAGSNETGFFSVGDSRSLVAIEGKGESLVVALSNKGEITVHSLPIFDHGSVYNPDATESTMTLLLEKEVERKLEFYYGSGYLSQSSRSIIIPPNATLQSLNDRK